jgi:hypothetical protein
MMLCSPDSVSLCLHLLVLSDLLIFSTSAPQPYFTVSAMHLCSFLLLCFMLCVPCPFYEFQLLHSASLYTPESLSTTPPISSLFIIFILSVHLLHPLFTMLLHALLVLSALPNHHHNSLASLVVKPMHSSSLSVMPRFLSLSSSSKSSSSLSDSSSFPLLQFQAPTIVHLSIVYMNTLHFITRCLETLQLLWRSH